MALISTYISDNKGRRHDDDARGHDSSHLYRTQIQSYCQIMFSERNRSAAPLKLSPKWR